MKALKTITIITFAVLLCGIVSVMLGPRLLQQQGLAYRTWLLLTLLFVTLILCLAFCVLLWIVFSKTISRKSRIGFRIAAGIIAVVYTPVCLLFSWFLGMYILIGSDNKEWIEEDNGVKYVVVDESFLMRVVYARYIYVNDFVRGSETISTEVLSN